MGAGGGGGRECIGLSLVLENCEHPEGCMTILSVVPTYL